MTFAKAATVLLVEDAPTVAGAYASALVADGHRVLTIDLTQASQGAMRDEAVDVVVVDLQRPDSAGPAAVRRIASLHGAAQIIVVSVNGSISAAVDAMRVGAADFIVKPVSADRLRAAVRSAIARATPPEDAAQPPPSAPGCGFAGFIGDSAPMRRVYRLIEAAAASTAPVFITGESGTGKELAAEALHTLSARKDRPFVAINCGAIPRDLVESELFGHAKGAFTGALADRTGAVKQADGGTLFLDEIGEMPIEIQAKLLRFLQSKTIQRVGGSRHERVDARILCATNRNPLAELRAGRFREDLYYRLHVVPIDLPPLRERGDDILLIADILLARYAREERRGPTAFSEAAKRRLLEHAWPGNVRELQNVVRSAVIMNMAATITPQMLRLDEDHAPPDVAALKRMGQAMRRAAEPLAPETAAPTLVSITRWREPGDVIPLDLIERQAVESALAVCGGNMAKAAALLGVNPSTLYRRRQKLGLSI